MRYILETYSDIKLDPISSKYSRTLLEQKEVTKEEWDAYKGFEYKKILIAEVGDAVPFEAYRSD